MNRLFVRAQGLSLWLWGRERRWILYLAASLTGLGTFLEISSELIEDDDLSAVDTQIIRFVAELRQPWLTVPFIEITALGSSTLLTLSMIAGATALLCMRDLRGAAQLVIAMAGAGVWTWLTKHYFARARPDMVERLIEVGGFSFPSGHSSGAAALYVTLAIVFGRHVHTLWGRMVLLAGTSVIAVLIGFSRVYLGVHYPSDVVSGLAFGGGWALLLTAAFEWRRGHLIESARSDVATPHG